MVQTLTRLLSVSRSSKALGDKG